MSLLLLFNQASGGGGAVNYTLSIAGSLFTVTTNDIALRRGYSLPIAASSFTVNSNNIALRRGYSLPIAASAFAITSNNVGLTYTAGTPAINYTLSIAASSFTVTSNNIALRRGHSLVIAASSFAVTRNNVTLTYTSGAPLTISVSDAQAITTAFWANATVKKWLTVNEFISHK
jgi:hypothetical protein